MQLFVFSIQSQRLLLLSMLSVLDVRYSNETPERIIILLFYVDKEWEHFAVMNLGVDDALRKWSRYIIWSRKQIREICLGDAGERITR